ncbi:RidA family protein [Shewanella avicenniae]|uniref:RidA family protein n=1 Tax=Shewanella avicenniae TaxID=2814294 RepID=A0ABX7QRL1_9GAMM|nr:RidA family protein [Shewanella avicenniae]QSX33350.1 RidA family protein [Shewanella avicenniae]
MSIQRINPTTRWSDVTVYNGVARFVEVPECEPLGDMHAQVSAIMAQAEQKLALVGSDRRHVLAVTIYITDFANAAVLNEIWDNWFPAGCAPSRVCVQAALADPDYLVEMVFEAAAHN